MTEGERYRMIDILEVEISSFRGGGYKVKFDFTKNLLSWNDGYMWNNNFMKFMPDNQVERIRTQLPESGLLNWIEKYNSGDFADIGMPTANPSSWKMRVVFSDGTSLVSGHAKNFPKDWMKIRVIIEEATECVFRLR